MAEGDKGSGTEEKAAIDRTRPALNALLAVTHQPVVVMRESDTKLVMVNAAAAELLGHTEAELLAMDMKSLFGDQESFVAFAAKIYTDGAVDARTVTLATRRGEGRQTIRARVSARLAQHGQQVVVMAITNVEERSSLDVIERQRLIRDSVTGLYDSSYFARISRHELERAVRYERSLSLALLEIDTFKKFVAERGRDYANSVLAEVAQLCLSCVRDLDVVSRYRGDDLAVLLPETGLKGAKQVFERMRAAVDEASFADGNVKLSVSIGFSEMLPTDDAIADLLQRADKALYRAVEAGRNAVKVA